MTTPRYRWPDHAEGERREAQECAEEAARLIEEANRLLSSAIDAIPLNPGLIETNVTRAQALHFQALALQERIQRLMIQAQVGRSGERGRHPLPRSS